MAVMFKARPYGTGYIVYIGTIAGPDSYDQTNGYIVELPMSKVHDALAVINAAGNLQVKVDSISGNKVILRFYTIKADTSTGDISATEVANGTNLASVFVKLYAIGE